jgi:hypothetical protein
MFLCVLRCSSSKIWAWCAAGFPRSWWISFDLVFSGRISFSLGFLRFPLTDSVSRSQFYSASVDSFLRTSFRPLGTAVRDAELLRFPLDFGSLRRSFPFPAARFLVTCQGFGPRARQHFLLTASRFFIRFLIRTSRLHSFPLDFLSRLSHRSAVLCPAPASGFRLLPARTSSPLGFLVRDSRSLDFLRGLNLYKNIYVFCIIIILLISRSYLF